MDANIIHLQNIVEKILCDRIVSIEYVRGGFSGAIKMVATLDNNKKYFVKASNISLNDNTTTEMILREERIVKQLPAGLPVPKYYGSMSSDEWVVLVFEWVDVLSPDHFWSRNMIAEIVMDTSKLYKRLEGLAFEAPSIEERSKRFLSFRMGITTIPSDYNEVFNWVSKNFEALQGLEERGVDLISGSTLIHCDLSPENVQSTTRGTIFTDWAHAYLGNPIYDLVSLLVRVPHEYSIDKLSLLQNCWDCGGYSDSDIAALASLLTGTFLERALKNWGFPSKLNIMRTSFSINGLHWIRQLLK